VAAPALDIGIALHQIILVKVIFPVFVIVVAVQAVQKIHVLLMGKMGRGLACVFRDKKMGNPILSVTTDSHQDNKNHQNAQQQILKRGTARSIDV